MHKVTTVLISHILCPNRKDSRYSEKDAAVIVRQMLKVAAKCHLHGLVHRDMKPEVYSKRTRRNLPVKSNLSFDLCIILCFQNFLFKSTKEDSPLKATDFGLSNFIRPGVCICCNYLFHSFPFLTYFLFI